MNILVGENFKYKCSKFVVLAISIGASIFIPDASKGIIAYFKGLGIQQEISITFMNFILFLALLIVVFLFDNFIDRRSCYGEFSEFVEKLNKNSEYTKEVNSNYANQLGRIEQMMNSLHIEKLNSIREHTSKLPEDGSKVLSKFIKNCKRKQMVKQNKINEFYEEIENLNDIIVYLTRLDSIVEKKIKNLSTINNKPDNEEVDAG